MFQPEILENVLYCNMPSALQKRNDARNKEKSKIEKNW